jgi:phage protein D
VNQRGFSWGDIQMGDPVTCAFGGHADVFFTGVITAIRHYSVAGGLEMVEILALDPLCKLGASRHTRIFEEQKDSDIVSSVLGDAGLEAGVVDSTAVTHDYVLQRNESDLVFLRRLAARNGYQLRSAPNGKADFIKAQFGGGETLRREQVMQFDYMKSHQGVPPNLTVYGWNYMDKEMVSGTAGSGDIDPIGDGENGVAATGSIWQADSFISDVLVSEQSAALEIAKAELNRHARTYVRGRVVTIGNGALRAGTKITFDGYAAGFNPEGYIVGSRHVYTRGHYHTEFNFVGNTEPK